VSPQTRRVLLVSSVMFGGACVLTAINGRPEDILIFAAVLSVTLALYFLWSWFRDRRVDIERPHEE
jgi:hypothetical protein